MLQRENNTVQMTNQIRVHTRKRCNCKLSCSIVWKKRQVMAQNISVSFTNNESVFVNK